jgi:hypothetical protein
MYVVETAANPGIHVDFSAASCASFRWNSVFPHETSEAFFPPTNPYTKNAAEMR